MLYLHFEDCLCRLRVSDFQDAPPEYGVLEQVDYVGRFLRIISVLYFICFLCARRSPFGHQDSGTVGDQDVVRLREPIRVTEKGGKELLVSGATVGPEFLDFQVFRVDGVFHNTTVSLFHR